MDSRTFIVQPESTHTGDPLRHHNAVNYLQRVARSGRAALIPGALEPIHQDQPRVMVYDSSGGADLSLVGQVAQPEGDRDAGGVPADPVTPLDYVGLTLLRLTDLLIRLLRTTPTALVASNSTR